MLSKAGEHYRQLSDRDRLILMIGAPIIILLLWYLLLGSALFANKERAVARYERALLDWQYPISGNLTAVPCQVTSEPESAPFTETVRVISEGIDPQMQVDVREPSVNLHGASANGYLAVIKELLCRGYEIQSLEIRASESATATANITMAVQR